MTHEERLRNTVESIDDTIQHIATRPGMYVGGDEHLHTAEVMVRVLLHVRDEATGRVQVDRSVERSWLFEKYPDVPGPVRSVTTGARRHNLDFTKEILDYVAWYNAL